MARKYPMHRSQSRMDSQQQQMINREAQEFTDAVLAACKTTSDSTVMAQQLVAQHIGIILQYGDQQHSRPS